MLMFLLAWLYDVQSPADDGSCPDYDTESDCLQRKTVMDTTQSYCQWMRNPDDAADDGEEFVCEFAPAKLNIKVMIYIAVIVALFVSICTKPIDVIFDLLSAPTADSLKVSVQDTALKRFGRRVSNAARRMSAAAGSLATAAKTKLAGGGTRNRKSIIGVATRKLPAATETAHALASASMQVLFRSFTAGSAGEQAPTTASLPRDASCYGSHAA